MKNLFMTLHLNDKKLVFKSLLNRRTVDVMGFPVFAKTLEDLNFSAPRMVINTINAYSYVMAKKDEEFRKALKESDVLVPDGFSIVLASRILNKVKIKKIAGADIFDFMCRKLNGERGKCVFLGSSEATLQKIKIRMTADYPDIQVYTYSPPFKPKFSDDDNRDMIEFINSVCPDVLFIGMTAPKQEKWVHQNVHNIRARVICSIGAVFDFYALTNKRPGKFWVSANLEWFIRLVKEPRRLWKRYLVYSPVFFLNMIVNKRAL